MLPIINKCFWDICVTCSDLRLCEALRVRSPCILRAEAVACQGQGERSEPPTGPAECLESAGDRGLLALHHRELARPYQGSGAASVSAAPIASMNGLPLLPDADQVIEGIRIWVADAVRTESLHQSSISAPVRGPVPHVVVARVVHDAVSACARRLGVYVVQYCSTDLDAERGFRSVVDPEQLSVVRHLVSPVTRGQRPEWGSWPRPSSRGRCRA